VEPVTSNLSTLRAALAAAHRRLDELFGSCVAALDGPVESLAQRLEAFDAAFRRHAKLEETLVYDTLAPLPEFAELLSALRLEHTQIRELCGIARVKLDAGERDDVRLLAGNLARRLGAHEEHEEESLAPGAEDELSAESRKAAVEALAPP
jgi:hemerythrin-like domain-containing protein